VKFIYPKKGSNLDRRNNSSIYGNYPLSSYNTWHGGIHEETRLAPLVAISDARIIAYKLPSEYLFTAHECPEMYSNGFILLQHNYKSPKEKELTFYSLYHHIASKFDITHNKLEVPSFLSKKVTKIKASHTPKGVRGRSASLEEGKTRGAETVLIPKNHIVTRNGEELLADWAKTYNTGKAEKKKYYSYTYTDPFTNTIYSDIHIYSGCLQLVAGETNKYKVTYETDTNTTTGKSKKQTDALNAELEDGALLYNIAASDFGSFGKGTCIGVIPKDTEITVIEGSESEDKKWVRVKDSEKEYEGYVQARDFEEQKTFDSEIKVDEIVACDIPVKAGEMVAYVGAFGFNKNENNYSSHVELFTDASDTDVSDLLDNCAGDGEENFQRYKMLSGATLEPYVQSSKELKAGTPVRVTSTKGDYVRVKVKALVEELINGTDIAVQMNGSKYARDTVVGKSRTRYKIVESRFTHVNKIFNGLLSKDSYLYWDSKVDDKKRNILFATEDFGKEFWIDKSHLKLEVGQTVTSRLETILESDSCHTYVGEPYTPHERGNTFKKERELSGKPQITVTDDDGELWYFIAESYDFEKECYQHIGWIKTDDAHLELINPFVWSNFGFKMYDAGSEYVYAMKDYHKSEKTDAFIDELWKMVDEDGDGILSPIEFLRAQRNPYTSERMGKMVVKHKSEWSYDPEKIKSEALEFYKLGLDLEKDPDKKKLLEQKRDADLEHLVEKAKKLMFWKELQNTTYTPKTTEKDKEYEEKKAKIKQKYARFLGEEGMSENSKTEMNAELDVLDQEYKKGKYKEETRKLPSSDMLWHFNMNSFVRQMRVIYGGHSGSCLRCNTDFTYEQIKSIFPAATKNETLAKQIIEELNKIKNNEKYKIDSCQKKAHLITQFGVETGFNTLIENLKDYSVKGLKRSFKYFRQHPDEAQTYLGNTKELAKRAYGNRLGNESLDEGYKYMGRGLIQLTGKDNYKRVNKEFKKAFPSQGDLLDTPELLEKPKFAVMSAMSYWMNKGLNELANQGGLEKVDEITTVINKHTKSYEKRRNLYESASLIFNVDNCELLGNNTDSCEHCNKSHIDLSDASKWMSQFNDSEKYTDEKGVVKMKQDGCWRTSVKVLKNYGVEGGSLGKKLLETYGNGTNKYSNVIQTVINMSDGSLKVTGDELLGVRYIDSQLSKKKPVLVGVDKNKNKTYNKDNSTEHFFVITGRKCENGKIYYRYFEVGTYESNKILKGITTQNKLYLKEDNTLAGIKPIDNTPLTVTQVRKNK